METLYYIVGIIIGFICGIGIGRWVLGGHKEADEIGTLRVHPGEEDEPPYLFLELDPGGMDVIYRKKTVQLRVNLKGYFNEDNAPKT